jgi:hypothetical protein
MMKTWVTKKKMMMEDEAVAILGRCAINLESVIATGARGFE